MDITTPAPIGASAQRPQDYSPYVKKALAEIPWLRRPIASERQNPTVSPVVAEAMVRFAAPLFARGLSPAQVAYLLSQRVIEELECPRTYHDSLALAPKAAGPLPQWPEGLPPVPAMLSAQAVNALSMWRLIQKDRGLGGAELQALEDKLLQLAFTR